ncbi:MAG: hypothetical protein KAS07_01405 [Candidatus Pacebacteria bacterium]|nr:hypothetical protein [Candidatus Paceibacterota bacterium]
MRNKGIKIILNILLIVVISTTILGYAYFRTQAYLQGPQVTIDHPQNGATITKDPLISILGTTERVSDIHLNGRKISINMDGNFSEHLLLYPGYNIITVEAADRFKKTIQKRLEIIYQDTE